MTTEARELDLVGKVEMRIALAKDDKLESLLKPYLPPLLLKLASDHASVRNKVCPHVIYFKPSHPTYLPRSVGEMGGSLN